MTPHDRPHDAPPTLLEGALSAGLGVAAIIVFCYGMIRLAEWIVGRFSL